MPPPVSCALLAALALLAAFFWSAARRARRALVPLLDRIRAAEAELDKLRSEPRRLEYRIEAFDVLWFPSVTIAPKSKEVLQLSTGIPHCKRCVAPLSSSGTGGDWSCAKCGAGYPASLADIRVTEPIAKEAARLFQERHPDYGWP